MAAILRIAVLAVLVISFGNPATLLAADRAGRSTFHTGDGVNRAPQPGTFTVVSVDSYNQIVRMRASDGSVGDVYVGSGTYDISKLNPGDRIQVDFLEPDGTNSRVRAGNIWKVK